MPESTFAADDLDESLFYVIFHKKLVFINILGYICLVLRHFNAKNGFV